MNRHLWIVTALLLIASAACSDDPEAAVASLGADCPVTIAEIGAFTPPDGYPETPSVGAWYGSDALWTTLPRDGDYEPRKSVWWSADFLGGDREAMPEIAVSWTRADGSSPPITAGPPGTNAYTAVDGDFMIAGIDPDVGGCWTVTATYKGTSLSYTYYRR